MTVSKLNDNIIMYDRQSIRLREYDYSQNGPYFITLCTKKKWPYFDIYPELKEIVQSEWEKLPVRFPAIINDAFVIMPNHLHAIIFIIRVGATLEVARWTGSSPAPTIGSIIGAYKSVCVNKWAKYLNQNGRYLKESFWQRNYFEHVVRDENELNLVREYVALNPSKWSNDCENPDRSGDWDFDKMWQWLER